MMDSEGKVLALLWQLCLVLGGSVEALPSLPERPRHRHRHGRGEKMADMRSILGMFVRFIRPQQAMSGETGAFMWPRAIAVPGWRHQIDVLLRFGLFSLPWFPGWLKGLEAVAGFMRNANSVQSFSRAFAAAGLIGLAQAVRNLSAPPFADWRWGTLYSVAIALQPLYASIATHFDISVFQRCRDASIMALVADTFSSSTWRCQSDFVAWFSGWLTEMQNWIGGCPCHSDLAQGGAATTCPWKGRRFAEGERYVSKSFECALERANGWKEATWGCGHDFLLSAQGAVRAVVAHGRLKFDYLGRLPYLLCQLPSPGGRRRILDQ